MTVKEVRVELTEADMKAITKRSRTRRKAGGATVESVGTVAPAPIPSTTVVEKAPEMPPPETSQATQPAQAAVQATEPTQSIQPISQATTQVATTPATTQQGGVRIKTRKRVHGSILPPTPAPSKAGARIVPVKRHAQPSRHKPRLHIPNIPKGGAVTETAAAMVAETATTLTKAITSVLPAVGSPAGVGGGKRKRRFTERRIGIAVQPVQKTRKASKSIRKKVAAMPVDEIRRILTEKGIVKGKKTPDAMLRSLMKDFLSIQSN